MEKRKRKLLVTLTLALALVFSMTTLSFASEEISTRQVGAFTIGFERPTSTSANGLITADTFSTAEYIKATVTLQKRIASGVFEDVPGQVKSKTMYNTSYFYFSQNWTLQNNQSYRLKVILEDQTNGNYFRTSGYSNIE